MMKFSIYQLLLLRNRGVKFDENRITLEPCPHKKSALRIFDYTYKWLKNIGIVMRFGMNVYFVNLTILPNFVMIGS